ncbi:hypothetical protein BDQ94DRAFT_143092, partial [Aspergillus welwitschiae]
MDADPVPVITLVLMWLSSLKLDLKLSLFSPSAAFCLDSQSSPELWNKLLLVRGRRPSHRKGRREGVRDPDKLTT